MKKFSSVLIVSCGLVLFGGCSLSPSPQQDLFAKKQECLSYKIDMENDMKNYISKRSVGQEIQQDIEDQTIRLYLRDIFYSSKYNSCLYVFNKAEDTNDGVESYIEIQYYIVDYLNNKKIYETSSECINNNMCDIEQELRLEMEKIQ